jgi:hypothetical protein
VWKCSYSEQNGNRFLLKNHSDNIKITIGDSPQPFEQILSSIYVLVNFIRTCYMCLSTLQIYFNLTDTQM